MPACQECDTEEDTLPYSPTEDETRLTQHNLERTKKKGFCKVDYTLIRSGTLTTTEIAVYTLLCSHINQTTGRLDPGIRTMAKELHVSPTTVSKALTSLESKGIITTLKRNKSSNFYTLNDLQNTPKNALGVPDSDTGGVPDSGTKLNTIRTSNKLRRRPTCRNLTCPLRTK